MSKVDDARSILAAFGLPRAQQNERSALTLLALAGIRPRDAWRSASQSPLRTVDIIEFIRTKYRKNYAPNTRETIRRQTLHQFEQARIVDRNPDDPSRPTNSGLNAYALTESAVEVLRTYRTREFDGRVASFISNFGSLQEAYSRARTSHRVPLRMRNGSTVYLSPGKHNELQVAVVEQFGPRFAPGATVLYVGDTAEKHVVYEARQLTELGIPITQHDKLPDIILHWPDRKWVYLIEAVTSHGPVSPKRHREIEAMLSECPTDRVYVSAFLDVQSFRKFAGDIAWETEVWIAEQPDHMIHFNGPKFLGPYKPNQD
jgi:hypothetical protein